MIRYSIRDALILFAIWLLSGLLTARAQAPAAAFIASRDSGCAPLLVNFTNVSQAAVAFSWNFGNGNSSILQHPSTTFTQPGSYTVSLICISQNGLRDTSYRTIFVSPKPVADFTTQSDSGCSNANAIPFNNTSAGGIAWIWDFGDGTSSSASSPTHTYAASGVYPVKLIAVNSFGCQDIAIKPSYITIHPAPTAQASVSQASSCDVNTVFQFNCNTSGITSWFWDFGDGTTSSGQSPAHQYGTLGNFPVTLVVSDANGCSDTASLSSQVHIGPTLIPSFTVNDSGGCAPLGIQYNCTVPNALTWSWDFGDGNTSSQPNPQHLYQNPGTYSVSLSVTTQNGCNGSVSIQDLIHADSVPSVGFTIVQDSGCAPFTASFINQSNNNLSCIWDFGNGRTSSLHSPTETYPNDGTYPVSLTVSTPNGCANSITSPHNIVVIDPKAGFVGTPLMGCQSMTVQFTHLGSPGGISNYRWDFGDGNTSASRNPSHNYSSPGIYDVTLVVESPFGCKDTVTMPGYVNIISNSTGDFIPDTFLVCKDEPFQFFNPSPDAIAWSWNLGNGLTSAGSSPVTAYSQTGWYTVTLQATLPGGCLQNFRPFAFVKVIPYSPQPIDIFHNNPCRPYVVTFSTTTPDITACTWDFGDGNSSTDLQPVHTYQQAGTYYVTLNLIIGEGCLATISDTVTVGYSSPISINPTAVCANTPANFSVINASNFSAVTWIFGDGQTSVQFTTSHTYTDTGRYSVRLITTDLNGCVDTFQFQNPLLVSDPKPDFSIPSQSCAYNRVNFVNQSQGADTYSWNFGNGTVSSNINPSRTFSTPGTYSVTLYASRNGCTKSKTKTINITQPDSRFSRAVSGACLPVTASFTNLSTAASTYQWLLGDGDSSSLQNPVHTYTAGPQAPVSLIAIDSFGCRDTFTMPPIFFYQASGSTDLQQGCLPLMVNFSGTSNGATTWYWDFGDGNNSVLQSPAHTYSTGGQFSIRMVAGFPGGCYDTVDFNDHILVSAVDADFNSPTVAGCSPTQISFINNTSDASSFQWDFGDGGVSQQINPQHIYYLPGVYTVGLIAENSFGCRDTIIKPDYITIPGTITRFSIPDSAACQGEGLQFTDSSYNASYWIWDFGDGVIDTAQHGYHAYPDTGVFMISLITYDSIGCTSSYTHPTPVRIHATPSAMATLTDSTGCAPFATGFINLSQGAATYFWDFGDGNTSMQTSPVHAYGQFGSFAPQLVATSSFGCRDTFRFPAPVEVLISPAADFQAMQTGFCYGDTLTLLDASTNLQGATYLWNYGFGTSESMQPVVACAQVGTFAVQLTVTNSNGCTSTFSQPAFFTVEDTIPPPADPIGAVSVNDDDRIGITWTGTNSPGAAEFLLYRLEPLTGRWQLIHSDTASASGSTSIYNYSDTGLDTRRNTYSYKLQTVDHCGYRLPLDSLTTYTSINVSAIADGKNIQVSWTPYEGATVSSYHIYRRERPAGSPALIARVAGDLHQFSDTSLACPFTFEYRIMADSLHGGNLNAWSDTTAAQPDNIFESQFARILRTTVVENKEVLTEWAPPAILPDRVAAYHILRSMDSVNYIPIAIVTPDVFSYQDTDVEVGEYSYSYKIKVENDCQLIGEMGTEGKSILLKGNREEYKTTLEWSDYRYWDTGIDSYMIEYLTPQGRWIPIRTVDGNSTSVELPD